MAVFDFESERELVPMGIGIGRAFKAAGAIVNCFVEPQFTLYSRGSGQPAFKLFVGLNLQWAKKPKGGDAECALEEVETAIVGGLAMV